MSYANGKAAHLDLSPRATEFPYNHQNEDEWISCFLEMSRCDLELFFKALKFGKNVKLILVAGTASNRYYIGDFIKAESEQHGFGLESKFEGSGRNTNFYILRDKTRKLEIPLFSSGAGPAFQNGLRLVENVRLNSSKLVSYLS